MFGKKKVEFKYEITFRSKKTINCDKISIKDNGIIYKNDGAIMFIPLDLIQEIKKTIVEPPVKISVKDLKQELDNKDADDFWSK